MKQFQSGQAFKAGSLGLEGSSSQYLIDSCTVGRYIFTYPVHHDLTPGQFLSSRAIGYSGGAIDVESPYTRFHNVTVRVLFFSFSVASWLILYGVGVRLKIALPPDQEALSLPMSSSWK